MAHGRKQVNLESMSLRDKRVMLTNLNAKVDAKIKSIEKAGIHFRGSEYDVSRKGVSIGRMTGKSLDKAINQQLDFLTPSNSNRFVRGLNGAPLRVSDVRRLQHYKNRYMDAVNARNKEMSAVVPEWRPHFGATPDSRPGGFEMSSTPLPHQTTSKGLGHMIDIYKGLGTDDGFIKWAKEQQELDMESFRNFPVARKGILSDLESLSPTQYAALRHVVDIGAHLRLDYEDGGSDARRAVDEEPYHDTFFSEQVRKIRRAVRK